MENSGLMSLEIMIGYVFGYGCGYGYDWMSLEIIIIISTHRILGPIAVSYVYEIKGTYWTFGICWYVSISLISNPHHHRHCCQIHYFSSGTMVLAAVATTAAFK